MTPKGTTIPGPAGRTPPAPSLRTTRSAAKANTRPSTPITATGMDQAKPKSPNTSNEAKKALKEDDCYIDENPTTPYTHLRTLTLIIKKHSASAPKGMTRSLQALAALMHKSNTTAQHPPQIVDALAQKIGEHMESTLQAEMGKMSELVKRRAASGKTVS
ncbi:hypothetical protein H4582DRAFT_2054995 [Lactarius indigo]|nr:hypothetical protein H4582DRAFT_2054995 [Lactarius indigo]